MVRFEEHRVCYRLSVPPLRYYTQRHIWHSPHGVMAIFSKCPVCQYRIDVHEARYHSTTGSLPDGEFPEEASAPADHRKSMYCEGIGSPALEYGLLSTASRLAQSKGFHMMQQRSSSRLTNEEHSGRVWLWWAIYVFEKHVAARSDRPSVCTHSRVRSSIS